MIDLQRIQNNVPQLGGLPRDPGAVLSTIIPYLFVIAGLVLLLYLVWGGFAWMTSGGDPKALESAKAKITNAVVGFIILFASYWLVQLLGMALGIGQFGTIFGR